MNGKRLEWLIGGLFLGLVLAVAMILIKPIGASTQFVIMDGIIWDAISPIVTETVETKSGYTSDNSYLAKNEGAYAKNVANPTNYAFVFALSIVFGGIISKMTQGPKLTEAEVNAPTVWNNKFGTENRLKRYFVSFIGGMFILFGARVAGGCTSGHMMSGMMQTSLSGYLFAFGVFIIAVPVALIFYSKKGAK
jgi:hypothetical protein